MVRACCVLGCPSGANMPGHQFPKNPDQFKIWKETVWSPKISGFSDSTLHKCAVCYRHFKDNDYILGHRLRKLKQNVVPSLNLPALYTFNEEADKENVTSVNSFDHIETDCTTQMSVNEFNANEEKRGATSPKHQKLELLEKNGKKGDLTPKSSRLYSMAKTLRRRQISTMSKMKYFRRLRQVEKYSKSQTIQTLMSSISSSQRRFIHMQMRAAKYAPSVCTKLYHMIAKEKALAQ